jgi:hypothetical protein
MKLNLTETATYDIKVLSYTVPYVLKGKHMYEQVYGLIMWLLVWYKLSYDNNFCYFIGLRFDKDGANQRLWSKEDMNKFSKRAQCFVDTISNITVPGTGGIKVLCTRTNTHTHFFHFVLKSLFCIMRPPALIHKLHH